MHATRWWGQRGAPRSAYECPDVSISTPDGDVSINGDLTDGNTINTRQGAPTGLPFADWHHSYGHHARTYLILMFIDMSIHLSAHMSISIYT